MNKVIIQQGKAAANWWGTFACKTFLLNAFFFSYFPTYIRIWNLNGTQQKNQKKQRSINMVVSHYVYSFVLSLHERWMYMHISQCENKVYLLVRGFFFFLLWVLSSLCLCGSSMQITSIFLEENKITTGTSTTTETGMKAY